MSSQPKLVRSRIVLNDSVIENKLPVTFNKFQTKKIIFNDGKETYQVLT